MSGAVDSDKPSERALLINCAKVCRRAPLQPHVTTYQFTAVERFYILCIVQGRISSIVVKKCYLSSLWSLLVRWQCRIDVHDVHITLRAKKDRSGVKKASLRSAIVPKLLQEPWLWYAPNIVFTRTLQPGIQSNGKLQ